MGNGMLNNGNAIRMLDWLVRLITVLLIPMLLWVGSTMIGIDRRVTSIEASRFTAADGSRLWEELYKRPTFEQSPPQWFVERVDEIITRLERLEDRIR